MVSALRSLVRETLKKYNIVITKYSNLDRLQERFKASNVFDLFREFPDDHQTDVLKILRQSKSQLGQDVFALYESGLKKNGFFVEFGATNGVDLSNSYLLEKEFGWSGIVAEPATRWHEELKSNRSCHIETNCVWRESNKVLTFSETDEGEFSTIGLFDSAESRKRNRKHGKTYDVSTISLVDLLDKYNAPRIVDFLSIDTEGSEYEILSNCDFKKYQFRVITCEHNFAPQRKSIFSLLTSNGYVRKFEGRSRFDDWYVKIGLA
jgi:FkbM family methyltransferase